VYFLACLLFLTEALYFREYLPVKKLKLKLLSEKTPLSKTSVSGLKRSVSRSASHDLQDFLSMEKGSVAWRKAREEVVGDMLPYVKKIAYSLARRSSDPVEDLIQVGTIGMLKALEKYNPLSGTQFKTYATYFITGEIRHYLRDKSCVLKAPRELYELYYRVNQIVQRLSDELGRLPSDLEIAEALQCPVSKVMQAQDAERRRQLVSLDQFAVNDNGDETKYVEMLVDESYNQSIQQQESKLLIEKSLSQLPEELQVVVKMTFYEDLSQAKIAEVLNISQMQVSRRLRKALETMSHILEGTHNLKPVLTSEQNASKIGTRIRQRLNS
jgi:RNA polymerase sigma-B factor